MEQCLEYRFKYEITMALRKHLSELAQFEYTHGKNPSIAVRIESLIVMINRLDNIRLCEPEPNTYIPPEPPRPTPFKEQMEYLS